MKNKLTILLTACLLVAAYFAISEEKMKPDADGDGKVSYEEYKASKEKGHERQFKKWIIIVTDLLMLPKASTKGQNESHARQS